MRYLRAKIKTGTPYTKIRKITESGLEVIYPSDTLGVKSISWKLLINQCNEGNVFRYSDWDYDIITEEEAFLEMV